MARRYSYSTEQEREKWKARLKKYVIENGGAVTKRTAKIRFHYVPESVFVEVSKEVAVLLPWWKGWPSTPYVSESEIKPHKKTRAQAISDFRDLMRASTLIDIAERKKFDDFDLQDRIK